MTSEIILRKDALAIGRVRYFSGKPCKYGHISEHWSRDGRCVECLKVFQTEQKDEYLARHKRWRDKNESKVKAWNNRWRAENPEKVTVLAARRRVSHRAIINKQKIASEARRRANKLASGGSYTVLQIDNLFRMQRGKCANCFCSIKSGWHNDHIVPLSKGGGNDIRNIQLLCQPCNNKKYNKDPIVWAQKNGRLL